MGTRSGGRSASRGVTIVEASIAIAVLGVALAAMGPACVRSIRLARTAEAVDSLKQLSDATVSYVSSGGALASAPMTPAAIPRGEPVTDPAGTWSHPTWRALGFALEDPHWYSYRVDVEPGAGPIRLTANGDLDGDGIASTFVREVDRGPQGATAREGVVARAELE
jgi:type II secretory pathway pseudopilin PulG